MTYRVYFFLILFFLFSCKQDVPKDVLTQKKMEAVLWDIFKADEYIKRHVSQDSTKNGTEENRKLQMQIFTLHNITKESFDKSYAYYMSNTELMKNILDSISIKGTSEKYSLYNKPSGPMLNSEK